LSLPCGVLGARVMGRCAEAGDATHRAKGYVFFFGTFAPARRASDNPIATACLRLVTFFPELPLRNVPRLRSCIVFLTFDCAVAPYLVMVISNAAGLLSTAWA
jgi:hypothetical protein